MLILAHLTEFLGQLIMHDDNPNDYQKTQLGGNTYWHNESADQLKLYLRKTAYDIAEQLNYLYDDVQAGLFGESAKTGKFVEYLLEVKAQFPKPNEPI